MNHFLVSVIPVIFLFLPDSADSTSGGYYIKLLQHPSFCPLTSFCWPWNPTSDPSQELSLISNPVLRVSLSDFELPLRVGRLKGNYASCLSRRRKVEAVSNRNGDKRWSARNGSKWRSAAQSVIDGQERIGAGDHSVAGAGGDPLLLQPGSTTTEEGKRGGTGRREGRPESRSASQAASGAWCLLYPDTGRVHCHQKLGAGRPRYPAGRPSRHVYVIPQSCVDWSSGYSTQRVRMKKFSVTIDLPEGSAWAQAVLTSRKLKMRGVSRVFLTESEGKFAADDRSATPTVIPWTKGQRVDIADIRNKTFLSVTFMSHSASLTMLDNLAVFRIHKRPTPDASGGLDLTFEYMKPFWQWTPEELTMMQSEEGILGASNLLRTFSEWMGDSNAGEQSDCYATKLKRTQCSCRAVFHKSMDEVGAMRRIKAAANRVQREKDELDLQMCCDRMLRTMYLMGESDPDSRENTTKHGGLERTSQFLRSHYIYFNGRMACPEGSQSSQLLPNGTKTCENSGKFCCRRTRHESQLWDHEVRGRCWVLRSPKPAQTAIGQSRQAAKGLVSAAWVSFVLPSTAVVAFRMITRMLDERRRIATEFKVQKR